MGELGSSWVARSLNFKEVIGIEFLTSSTPQAGYQIEYSMFASVRLTPLSKTTSILLVAEIGISYHDRTILKRSAISTTGPSAPCGNSPQGPLLQEHLQLLILHAPTAIP